MISRFSYLLLLLLINPINAFCGSPGFDKASLNTDIDEALFPPPSWSTPWVDSVFQSLTLEQRIAQLIMVRVSSDRDEHYIRQQEKLIKQYNIGGVAFFAGGPVRQVKVVNRIQDAALTPLLVAMDAEWGPSMRLDSTAQFPRQITLGAIQDDHLIYEMGQEIGQQLRRLGVHINFAPVADVNNNPLNPVINFRSFGEDIDNVARKSVAYMKGMQDTGIFACAKHFPGHGDTDTDSHYALPVINHGLHEIDSIHLYPFRQLIRHGVHTVMVAHLHIPALDDRENLASSLSGNIVAGLLQDAMGFYGLTITDGLEMRGVSNYFKPGELELKALMAGNDILLLPADAGKAISHIKDAIMSGELSEDYLNDKCRKVLYYKQLAGLDRYSPVDAASVISDLNTGSAGMLNRKLARASVTLVKNTDGILPLKPQALGSLAAVAIGGNTENAMHDMMKYYHDLPVYSMPKVFNQQHLNIVNKGIADAETVIISVHDNSFFPSRNYGINPATVKFVNELVKEKRVILCLFANPYSLGLFDQASGNLHSVVVAYQDGRDFEEAAAQVIFGGTPAKGRLPVTAGAAFPVNAGITIAGMSRVGYGIPEDAGISSSHLKKIDSIAIAGIDSGAYPGCQVVLIKDGIVIYDKAFGYHTYNGDREVMTDDVYDLASLTKIIATTAAVMHLADQGKINVDHRLDEYLPRLRGTDKGPVIIRELLAHQARLQSWIPFYIETLENFRPSTMIYANQQSVDFQTEVANGLFIHQAYRDSIFTRIIASPLQTNKNYLYSDIGPILLSEIIHAQSGMMLDEYVSTHFYQPLSLNTIGFNPLRWVPLQRIVPTEHDTVFRKQLVHGHVHDPAAAMLGGISGHAGLFSNARNVAIMMQLFLQDGSYAGQSFIREETVREFSRVQYPGNKNRRGLGFDKPMFDAVNNGVFAQSASPHSFGHSGFTGTYAWADPKENLVYVFLSNRVHPSASNNKISSMNIRTAILQAAYNAIEKRGKMKSGK